MSRSDAIDKERRRVVVLLRAHEHFIHPLAFHRICNMVRSGIDLQAEMKRKVADRPLGFDWPDQPKKKKRRKKSK